MNLQHLKSYITANLLRVDGKLNSAITRRDYFKTSPEYVAIMNCTSFLPNDAVLPERLYCLLNDISEIQICPKCLTHPRAFSPSAGQGYRPTCGKSSCRGKEGIEKAMVTKISRYGSGMPLEHRENCRRRLKRLNESGAIKQSIREKYGVDSILEVASVRDKIKKTLQDRYGVDNSSNIPSRKKMYTTRRQRVYEMLAKGKVKDVHIEKRTSDKRLLYSIKFTCTVCNNTEILFGETFKWRCAHVTHPCTACSGIKCGSAKQNDLYTFVTNLADCVAIANDANVLKGIKRELDVYLPTLNLAFEFDGLFWHSFNSTETSEQRNLHLLKTKTCEAQGIQLVHIFENEWDNKKEIVKSCIAGLLGKNTRLFARKCAIKKISKKAANGFLQVNHLQGKCNHSTHHYGLFFGDSLVSVMTFGKPRFDKTVEWEMIRFCSTLNTHVVGGASKLFTTFVKEVDPNTVLSYSDRRWSSVNKCVYQNLGFDLIRESAPSYFYFKSQEGTVLFNRISFQKHKLKNKLEVFDASLTESENMFANGYRRIWDCGNGVWMWSKDKTLQQGASK